MAIIDLTMPKMGESIMEATILHWHKKPGDTIEEEETIVEIATDKVDSEIPAPQSGILKEILHQENEIVAIGAPIARIEISDESKIVKEQTPQENKISSTKSDWEIKNDSDPQQSEINQEKESIQEVIQVQLPNLTETNNNGFLSPLVKSIAKEENISNEELSGISGHGQGSRLTKNDLLNFIKEKKQQKPIVSKDSAIHIQKPATILQSPNATKSIHEGDCEIIEMDRLRQLIARNMKQSQDISATVTSFAEADVTNMVLWRNRIKKDFEKVMKFKITFTPMFMECLVNSLRKFPILNSSVDGNRIIIKKSINIGMATALPDDNLIVPVIKNAESKSLISLSHSVNTLAYNARHSKLKPSDVEGGTFTFTNVGAFDSLTGTPIINQPEVAVLAAGTIKKKPAVIETEQGDFIGIRYLMILALSYDHRIIDGSMGSRFLTDIVKEFEGWDVNRELKLVEQYVD